MPTGGHATCWRSLSSGCGPCRTRCVISLVFVEALVDLLLLSTAFDSLSFVPSAGVGGGFGPLQVVPSAINSPRSIDVADLDGDGDVDLIVGTAGPNDLYWFENIDGQATFVQHLIGTGIAPIFAVRPGDMDEDGDTDLVVAENRLAWLENLDGEGTFSSFQTIHPTGFRDVELGDVDRDGDLDVLARTTGDAIRYFENLDAGNAFAPGAQPFVSPEGIVDQLLVLGELDVVSGAQSLAGRWYAAFTAPLPGHTSEGAPRGSPARPSSTYSARWRPASRWRSR